MSKLWGGRFREETDALVQRYNASLPFDVRLFNEDIEGSIAWALALARADVLEPAEAEAIVAGLEKVRVEFQEQTVALVASDEDIHTAVERRLTEIVGPVGGKLHTGRSRNDQVVTDLRLWTMRATKTLEARLREMQSALVGTAEEHLELPMPGYTHLQHAQPVTWGHWALSHFWSLVRDVKRLSQVWRSAAVLPLGSAALAGTAYPIDREMLAQDLGFVAISQNSLDAVSDRDFAAEFLFAAAMIGLHLSRIAEQLILFSSAEFGFVTLSDAFSTGSSLMPQKKNPDTLELTRGKAGRLFGHLMGLLTTLKGLPSAYDKDLQEDKEPLFDAFDTLNLALPVMAGTVRTMQVRPERLAAQLEAGLLATDLADYLVRRGVPFRRAHDLVGQVVRLAEETGVPLDALTTEAVQRVSGHFGKDVHAILDVTASLAAKTAVGGTAPDRLRKQLALARDYLTDDQQV